MCPASLLWSYLEYQTLQSITEPQRKGYAGVAIALVAGRSLFAMRTCYRLGYGLTDAPVSLYLAWVTWTTMAGPFRPQGAGSEPDMPAERCEVAVVPVDAWKKRRPDGGQCCARLVT
jgi:hypothetical protein